MSETTTPSQRQTLGFQSEVRQLLSLMINSLYSNEEIFLRELISNAADAADKLKFLALSDDGLFEGDGDLRVEIEFDSKRRTVTVRDNGIGMSREEAIDNLGTIAKSGTRAFFAQMSGDAQKDSQLIGQFGVGFYSSFIVAERVVVTTRKAGLPAAAGVRWESDGNGEFSVESVDLALHGTEVTLHLKKSAREFADRFRLQNIIKTYSDHISIPIRMRKEQAKDAAAGSVDDVWEAVNTATALWTRNKKDISDDDYKAFYKHIAHDFEDPLRWLHNQVEGKLEYTTLFFVPARAPFDLWDRDARRGVKLFVQRVFIMDDVSEFLPRFLRFVRGVIDARDLPLNVSREILQHNKVLDTIRTASVKRILDLLDKLALTDEYGKFWGQFGRVLKEGIIEDSGNRERIAKLLRFSTTRDEKPDADVSLADYVGRMADKQAAIYYLTADTFATARSSAHLERFRARGIEVVLLSDSIDEWLVSHLSEFDGKPLRSVAHGALDLDQDDAADKPAEQDPAAGKALADKISRALGERVKEVRVSTRLTSSPACLVSDDYAMSANMERILRAAGQQLPAARRILEINPAHPILRRLADEQDEGVVGKWSDIVFDQALLAEGGRLEDPAGFVKRMNEVIVGLMPAG